MLEGLRNISIKISAYLSNKKVNSEHKNIANKKIYLLIILPILFFFIYLGIKAVDNPPSNYNHYQSDTIAADIQSTAKVVSNNDANITKNEQPIAQNVTSQNSAPVSTSVNTMTCGACKGSGSTSNTIDCSNCRGAGYFVCSTCRGAQDKICISCSGKGGENCFSCRGKGKIFCSQCGGKGTYFNGLSGRVEVCLGCNGQKSSSCNDCEGSGIDKCFNCSGSGKTPCMNCNRTGQIICSTCLGKKVIYQTSTCNKCNGSGQITL
jgi:hypothetical protein